jgi:uncharacterized protein (TIGR03435 family)
VQEYALPMNPNIVKRKMVRMTWISVTVLAIFWTSTSSLAVRTQKSVFEVATIKPSINGGGVSGGCRGIDSKLATNDIRVNVPLGRCVIRAARLSHLMSIAFDIPLQRISGFPDWDGPSRFDIEAKSEAPSTTTEPQLLGMLQQFLTDQFKLTIRRDSKELPIFNLVVAKNGPKNLHPSDEPGPSTMPQPPGLIFKGYSMTRLAEFLSVMPSVARPVRDMTSMDGRFDFTLNALEAKSEDIADMKMQLARWDSVFSDLQQQLGLRLESAKAPVDTLVIEHAEKPAN